ncbi:LamG-like jellyroll fold domain-containing protein [Novipirellula artificiosorum]|uniref:FecR protein n=1 Tax=Novipirellula artificiosorum TaxID=2528016 RepID=A0A5C6D6P2_9BACT|nr:LamG-like jellyroll fold domain-containing protein [Novipirellula artificiosorum]TWU31745.1 FecR protein [Novipirellula artificiosorum]
MSLDEATSKELEDILALMGGDAFDDDARQRLNMLVSGSDDARRIYLENCQMQAMLQQSTLLASLDAEKRPAKSEVSGRSQRSLFSWVGWAVAASVVFVIGLAAAGFFGDSGGTVSAPSTMIACVEELDGLAWFDESELSRGENVPSGAVRLESGSMELRFDHGTRLLVHGPAQLSIDSDMQVSLVRGQIAAQVTEVALGFTVLGPDAAVVDLGTEFAMAVTGGESWVEVYDGEVEVVLLDEDGRAWKSRELLTSDAVRIDASKGQIIDEASPVALPRLAEASLEPLSVPGEYVESVQNADPTHYWRFETTNERGITDTMGDADAVLHGGARLQNGGVYFPPGRRNHGYVLIDRPMTSLLNDEFTLEMWMNPSFTQRTTLIDINHRQPESGSREKLYRISLMPMHDQRVFPDQSVRFISQLWPYGEQESVNDFSSQRYTPGSWHHVVAVRRDNQIEIYLNGNAVESALAPPTGDPLDAMIAIGAFLRSEGSDSLTGQIYFKGMIDELALYPRALAAEDVAEHYRLMRGE